MAKKKHFIHPYIPNSVPQVQGYKFYVLMKRITCSIDKLILAGRYSLRGH